MKGTYFIILDELYHQMQKVDEVAKENLQNFEKFMVWIIGFAVGAITLILSDVGKSQTYLGTLTVKYLLGLLLLCILSGVVYRYVAGFVMFYGTQLSIRLLQQLKDSDIPLLTEIDVSSTDFERLVVILGMYGKDYSYLKDEYAKSSPQIQDQVRIDLRQFYKDAVAEANQDVVDAKTDFRDTLQEVYGLSNKKMAYHESINFSTRWKQYGMVYKLSSVICLLSFLATGVVAVVCYMYVN